MRKRIPGAASLPFLPSSFSQWEPLQRAQFLEITFFFSQYLLASQGDRVAMANSVEGRFPFLDIRLVEWCNRLPAKLKLKGLEEKWLLREVGRDWLPSEIWQRVKRPYRAPIHRSFFHEHSRSMCENGFRRKPCGEWASFKPAAVNKLVVKVSRGAALGETDDMALAAFFQRSCFIIGFRRIFLPRPRLGPGMM